MSTKTFNLREESIIDFFKLHAINPAQEHAGRMGGLVSHYIGEQNISVKKTCPVGIGDKLIIEFDSYEQVGGSNMTMNAEFICEYYDDHSNKLKRINIQGVIKQ